MEPVQAQSINIAATKSLCSTVSNGDKETNDISKQLEHDLLYGDGDADGDDGDALSDDNLSEDSYRLRLSDDETDGAKDNASKTVDKQDHEVEDKTEKLHQESTPNTDSTETKLLNSMTNGLAKVNSDVSDSQPDDFTNDDVLGNNNFCDDSKTFNSEPCPQLNNLKECETSPGTDEPMPNSTDDASKINDSDKKLANESEVSSKEDDAAVVQEEAPEQPAIDECDSVVQDPQAKIADESSKIEDARPDCEIDESPAKEACVTNGDDESSDSGVNDKSCDNKSESPNLECHDKIPDGDDGDDGASMDKVATPPESETNNDEQDNNKRPLDETENDDSAPKKIACIEHNKDNGGIEIVDETSASSDKSLVDPKDLVADFSNKTNSEIIQLDDDNTLDSLASEVLTNANENVDDPSDSSTDKTKQINNVIKETDAEKENSDSSRHQRRRRTGSDALLIAGNETRNTRSRKAATEKKPDEPTRKSIGPIPNSNDAESTMTDPTPVPNLAKSTTRRSSPASLKRKDTDIENDSEPTATAKKFKTDTEKENAQTASETKKKLDGVRRFFLRDTKNKLKKLSPEELEDMLIQKIIEAITMRDEIGKLREQAKIAERNQEATRTKCQQLAKQINDFEMVLNRYAADRRSNVNTATPVKINRSVGLQVNFLTDQGAQNLRQLQTATKTNLQKPMAKAPPVTSPIVTTSPQAVNDMNNQNARRGIKTRSPRRTDAPAVAAVTTTAQIAKPNQPLIATMTPSAIPISKAIDTRNSIASTGQMPQQLHASQIIMNGTMNNLQNRTAKVLTSNTKSNANVIDLTDEEEKKSVVNNTGPPPLTTIITSTNNTVNGQRVQARYTRVVPSTATVTIPQSAIRVVQPACQPTPTALVNNMSNVGGTPRFVVMQPGRQLVLAPNSQVRATSANTRTSLPTVTYATNGTVRVVPTSGTTTVQLFKHPAPLPDVTSYQSNPSLKLPPPAPSLKITKVPNGIVLSWNVALSDKYAEIASYQLYAYQEMAGVAPSTSNWKKVGDVRALPLPMACTLTQFSEGNNYYFAVRAVDTHSRYGQYSQPGNISL